MEEFKFLSYKIETSTARGVKIIFAYNHHHLSTKQESDKEKNGILISEFGYIHKQIVTTSSTQINIII